MQIVHIANWCTWLAHTLCKVWHEIIKIVEHSLDFHLGSCKHFDEVENVSGISFFFDWYRILFWNFEICIISLFSFGWWYTLMKNKHLISLYLDLKKNGQHFADNIFKWIFLLKKLLSVFLSASVFLSVCLCLSVCACHTFFTMFPSWYHHEIFRSDYQWQKWCLCKSSGQRSKVKVTGTEVKTQISRFGTITLVWFHIWWWNDAQSLILFRSDALLIFKVICQISRSHG